jgi:hypothetical protein
MILRNMGISLEGQCYRRSAQNGSSSYSSPCCSTFFHAEVIVVSLCLHSWCDDGDSTFKMASGGCYRCLQGLLPPCCLHGIGMWKRPAKNPQLELSSPLKSRQAAVSRLLQAANEQCMDMLWRGDEIFPLFSIYFYLH